MGIKNKNILKIKGMPIGHSIMAKSIKKISKVIVSTDSKIAKIASQYGAEVPFLRPKNYQLTKVGNRYGNMQ